MSPLDDNETTRIIMRMASDIAEIKAMTKIAQIERAELKTAVKRNQEAGCNIAQNNREQIAGMKKVVYSVTGALNAIGVYFAHLLKG